MGGMFGPYIEPILNALLMFPLVAYVLTLPYCALNYRRFGGIAALRTVIFYSFILYMLCAFLLTVLPLPDVEDVLANGPVPVQPIPFGTLTSGMALGAAAVFGTLIVTMRLMGKSRRWPHDVLSKTMVINVRRPDAPGKGEHAPEATAEAFDDMPIE